MYKKLCHQFLSQNHLRQIWKHGWGSSSVAMSSVPVSTINSRFCKMHDSKEKQECRKDRTSDIRLHCPTTVSTVPPYLGCILPMSKSSHCYLVHPQFITVNVRTLLQGIVYNSLKHNALCSLFTNRSIEPRSHVYLYLNIGQTSVKPSWVNWIFTSIFHCPHTGVHSNNAYVYLYKYALQINGFTC